MDVGQVVAVEYGFDSVNGFGTSWVIVHRDERGYILENSRGIRRLKFKHAHRYEESVCGSDWDNKWAEIVYERECRKHSLSNKVNKLVEELISISFNEKNKALISKLDELKAAATELRGML